MHIKCCNFTNKIAGAETLKDHNYCLASVVFGYSVTLILNNFVLSLLIISPGMLFQMVDVLLIKEF